MFYLTYFLFIRMYVGLYVTLKWSFGSICIILLNKISWMFVHRSFLYTYVRTYTHVHTSTTYVNQLTNISNRPHLLTFQISSTTWSSPSTPSLSVLPLHSPPHKLDTQAPIFPWTSLTLEWLSPWNGLFLTGEILKATYMLIFE